MTQREEFEKYALTRVVDKRSLNYNHADGHYVEWLVEEMYRAWQAAKAQAVPEVSQSISNPMPSGYMLNTLIKFQKWRTGKDERTLDETGLTPKLITQAIDWAIEQLDKSVAQAVPDKGE